MHSGKFPNSSAPKSEQSIFASSAHKLHARGSRKVINARMPVKTQARSKTIAKSAKFEIDSVFRVRLQKRTPFCTNWHRN
jgi:hypothetical protein